MRIFLTFAAICVMIATSVRGADVPSPRAPAPLSEAARRMSLPEGFQASLFAGEPDIRQPIAFTFDDRGRLWVVECDSYPNWIKPSDPKRDRVLIFEDRDGDGRFDSRKVFLDKAQNLTGIALGFGGVWLCSTPNLLFVPDRDHDDQPDGSAEVLLDGWDIKGEHNMFNDLTWGPDGWLWGCNGIMSNSKVGPPGTPEAQRTKINCGVWRYHPTRKVFDVVANGTTNPWGLDFDEHGQAFITNCVIPHLFHVIPGAHFDRMYGQDFNSHLYGLISTCADHIHWAGGNWTDSRGGQGKHSEAGGGHAHVGAMIYQGAQWPQTFESSVFTCNLHGNRVNRDVLTLQKSGYVATHAPDFLVAHDTWFRGIALKYGPDGSTFLLDWSDTDECHDTDSHGPERENGRIYRISYGEPAKVSVDLAAATDSELVGYQTHRNEWFARHARRILQERGVAGQPMAESIVALKAGLASQIKSSQRLRLLWTLFAVGGATPADLRSLLSDRDEDIRAWAVRLLARGRAEGFGTDEDRALALVALVEKAAKEPSPRVRLELASAMAALPQGNRLELARPLAAHAEDATDPNLTLMIWYGLEPGVKVQPAAAVALAGSARIPLIRRNIAHRVVDAADEGDKSGLASLTNLLGTSDDPATLLDLIQGMRDALKGRKSASMPDGWKTASAKLASSKDPEVREQGALLAILYGDPDAPALLRTTMLDSQASLARRSRALRAMVDLRQPAQVADLLGLLDDPSLRAEALQGLAAWDDPAIAPAILSHYGTLTSLEKSNAVATLAARPRSAAALLDAVGRDLIPRRDLPVGTAQQILAFKQPALDEALASAWGTIRATSHDKSASLARYQNLLAPERMKSADPSRGQAVFARSCGQCHKMFGQGGEVGPELTGSDRANLSYILENVLDPSASVAKEYRLTNVATKDGRLISGIVRETNPRTMTLRTSNETLTLPRDDIEAITTTDVSMMPEGLFEAMSEAEVRDLVRYLSLKDHFDSPVAP